VRCGILSQKQRIALALYSGIQLPLVVAIAAIAVDQGKMPGSCGASLVMACVISVMPFPALASKLVREPAVASD